MSPPSPVVRSLYKQLMTLAWRFDAQPSLKALIHVHPFAKKIDKKLLQHVLPESRVMYWPTKRNEGVSITHVVRNKFRETQEGEDQTEQVSKGFRALKFLNERIHFARHLGLIGSIETLPNRKSASNNRQELHDDAKWDFRQEDTPKQGCFLVSHPLVSEPFHRTIIYLSSVPKSQDGTVLGVVLNDERILKNQKVSLDNNADDSESERTEKEENQTGSSTAKQLIEQITKTRRAAQRDKNWPEMSESDAEFDSDSNLNGIYIPVYSGGPVKCSTYCLEPDEAALTVSPCNLTSSNSLFKLHGSRPHDVDTLVKRVNEGKSSVFGSAAVWSRRQLFHELSLGYWVVVSHPSSNDVFIECNQSKMEDHSEEQDRTVTARPSTRMWEICLQSLGSEFAALTEVPDVELTSHKKAPDDYHPDAEELRSFLFGEGEKGSKA